MKSLRTALAGLALTLAAAAVSADAPQVNIISPWVQEAPPTAKVMAAYMTLENTDDQPLALTGAHSEQFGRIEIHATEMSGGMARMAHKDSIALPPHTPFAFAPGGHHFMLMEPQQALRAGDQVTLTLTFGDGRQLTIVAEVRKAVDTMDHSGHAGASHAPQHASPMQHQH